MEQIGNILERLKSSGALSTMSDTEAGYACPKCRDVGYIVCRDENGFIHPQICECEVKRRNDDRLQKAGLTEMVKRNRFETFQTPEAWQRKIKGKAEAYVADCAGRWFFIGGNAGSGKTHICSAIVGQLIEGGKGCQCFRWRVNAPSLKALVVSDRTEYETNMKKLTTAGVLYIDDFFKGNVTDGDINLAFEILDSRYNNRLPVVISSERDIEGILSIDEAVGSRIFEMSQGYCLKTEAANWRLRRQQGSGT